MNAASSAIHFPDEVNQSVVRTINTLVILLYLIIYSYITTGEFVEPYVVVALFYLVITTFLYSWSIRCINLPNNSIERISFRIIGFTGDIVILSIVMQLAEQGGIPLFFLFLWITVANGIRYGNYYLVISAILCIINFSIVVHETTIWQDSELTHVALGLLISLLMLPAYILSLISRLSNALDAERAANHLKRNFLANMNHELRTPLTSIINLVDLMERKNLSQIGSMLSMIRASTNNLLNIVNGILDIARIEYDQSRIVENQFNLHELIFELKQLLLPQAQKKGIFLYIHIDAVCEEFFIGPKEHIKNILINIISNSIKFTEHGYVKLIINANHVRNAGQNLSFVIEDTGIGIPKQFQKKIFKPYTQANSGIASKFGGSGLGLAICDQLAKLIGAEIILESTPGMGTKITFSTILAVSENIGLSGDRDCSLVSLVPENKSKSLTDTYKKMGIKVIFANDADSDFFLQAGPNLILLATRSQILQLGNLAYNYAIIEWHAVEDQQRRCTDYSLTSASENMDVLEQTNTYKICSKFINKSSRLEKITPFVRKLNILLAEDDKTLRELQRNIFLNSGHQIDVVKSGSEVMGMYFKNKYDVILLDMHLPELSGIEVIKQLRFSNPSNETKFVILTADSIEIDRAIGNMKLADKVLIKPISPANLLSEIYELFETPRRTAGTKNSVNETRLSHLSVFIDLNILKEHKSVIGESKLKEMIDDYKAEVSFQLKSLTDSIRLNQRKNYYEILHRMKGMSTSVGMVVFSRVLNYLEQCIIEDAGHKMSGKLLDQINSLHELSLLAYEVELRNEAF